MTKRPPHSLLAAELRKAGLLALAIQAESGRFGPKSPHPHPRELLIHLLRKHGEPGRKFAKCILAGKFDE